MKNETKKGLDGNQYKFDARGKEANQKSKPHKRALMMLASEFPLVTFCEEITIRINKYNKLKLDIYSPQLNLAVEVHGKQHYEFNEHFYESRQAFLRARHRDEQKREWCDINEITLVELKYDESDEQWRESVRAAVGRTAK